MKQLHDIARSMLDLVAVRDGEGWGVGKPDTVKAGLTKMAEATQADEFMLVCDVFDPALR